MIAYKSIKTFRANQNGLIMIKITKHNITLKKPGIGLNEKMINSILNKIAKKNISSKRIIRVGDFE